MISESQDSQGKMTKRARLLLLATSVAIAFVAGVSLTALYFQRQIANVAESGNFMVQFSKVSEAASLAKRGADADYETALRNRLTFLEENRTAFVETFSERVFALDQALTLVRIASLQEKRGETSQAGQNFARAESYCPQIGWSQCSSKKILEFSLQADNTAKGHE